MKVEVKTKLLGNNQCSICEKIFASDGFDSLMEEVVGKGMCLKCHMMQWIWEEDK